MRITHTEKRTIVRRSTLDAQGNEPDLHTTTAAERLGMMWQLTVDAWLFKGEHVAESRLSRHITHLQRRGS